MKIEIDNGYDARIQVIAEQLLTAWVAQKEQIGSKPSEPILLWQHDGCLVGISEDWGPAVPYRAKEHEDGSKNYGYRPLKGRPEDIAAIPELDGYPEFAELIAVLNADTSPLESVGCEKCFFPVDDVPEVTRMLGSYVDVVFSDKALNDNPENILQLASHLLPWVEECHCWWGNVEFRLQRMRHLNGCVEPWGLWIQIQNYGRSDDEARKWWAETLRRLVQAVARLPAMV